MHLTIYTGDSIVQLVFFIILILCYLVIDPYGIVGVYLKSYLARSNPHPNPKCLLPPEPAHAFF